MNGVTRSYRFPQHLRLKTPQQFQAIYALKRSVSDARLVVYAAPNGLSHSRLGLSVSKKVGNAVVRNRHKRLFREAFRLVQHELPVGLDLILIPRSQPEIPGLEQWKQSLVRLARDAARRVSDLPPLRGAPNASDPVSASYTNLGWPVLLSRIRPFPGVPAMAHTLPALPYDFKALEPHIDAMTMEIHSQRHHKAYVDNLNKALESAPDHAAKEIVTLLREIKSVPDAIRQAVINNGGGHHNHALFWTIMAPGAGGEPTGAIGDAIKATFGDFAKFKDTFKQNALTQFGSGWSWLVWDPAGAKIAAIKKPNQDSPLMDGQVPLLGCDVWEHAYYLKYQNKRADYVDAWWNVVNWKKVDELYAAAKAGK